MYLITYPEIQKSREKHLQSWLIQWPKGQAGNFHFLVLSSKEYWLILKFQHSPLPPPGPFLWDGFWASHCGHGSSQEGRNISKHSRFHWPGSLIQDLAAKETGHAGIWQFLPFLWAGSLCHSQPKFGDLCSSLSPNAAAFVFHVILQSDSFSPCFPCPSWGLLHHL